MGSVLSCPCRGEFSLLSLLIAHSKTNPFISKTQGRGFQAPLCAKLFCPGSRRARGSLHHWRPVGFLPIPAQFPALADPLIFQSFNLSIYKVRPCALALARRGDEPWRFRYGTVRVRTGCMWSMSLTGRGGGRESHLRCIARERGSHKQTSVCFRKIGIFAEVPKEESRLVEDTTI